VLPNPSVKPTRENRLGISGNLESNTEVAWSITSRSVLFA
jgi:hypothetical protein